MQWTTWRVVRVLGLVLMMWALWSGCSGAECKESCASSDECDDEMVCVTPIGQDKQCLPKACQACPETCSYNRDTLNGTCRFVSCPAEP